MKSIHFLGAALAAAALLVSGCNKDGSIDTSKVESSFSTADASSKGELDRVVQAVKAGDFAAATAPLQRLAANAKLTPEQQAAAKDLLVQIQEKVKEAAAAVGAEASDALKKAQDVSGDALKKAQDGAGEALDKARNATGDALKDLGERVKK